MEHLSSWCQWNSAEWDDAKLKDVLADAKLGGKLRVVRVLSRHSRSMSELL